MKTVDVQAIMEKEVTRKQFLTHIGLALLAVVGVPSFLKNLNSAFTLQPKVQSVPDGAYGMSAYSGLPAKSSKSAVLSARKVIRVQ